MRPPNQWSDIVQGYEYSREITDSPVVPPPSIHIGEDFLLGIEEANEPGYSETKEKLQNWYGCCQICNCQTPRDENGYATEETLTRAVRKKGGIYKVPMNEDLLGLSADNGLLLCPRHYVLWVRGLVKLPDLEGRPEEIVQLLKQKIKEYKQKKLENPLELNPWECKVFEGQTNLLEKKYKTSTEARSSAKSSWKDKKIVFTNEHLVGFLETMVRYFEEKKTRGWRT
jgi:hypothetical protein